MLVYGKNVAKEYLEKNKDIKKIYLMNTFDDKDIISLIESKKVLYKKCTKMEFDSLCSGVTQGIILSVPDFKYNSLETIFNNNDQIVVVLDHLEDPHNFGAIIRTCEAAGIKSIIIGKDRQVPVNSTVMKTSVGTVLDMNIVMVSNIANTIDKLKKDGYWVIGTALKNSVDYRDVNYEGKIAIVIGNEGKGISNIVEKKCDYVVKIPMYGSTNSLNASVAAGIMLYEVIRDRK